MLIPSKIIIGLLALIAIIAVVWLVMDYQKIERKHQACLEQCDIEFTPLPDGANKILALQVSENLDLCKAECKEKYGK